jgi:hypothetical protein
VAGGIPDAEKNRLILSFREGKGFFTPGVPFNRIVGVLEEIRAGLGNETVDEFGDRRVI